MGVRPRNGQKLARDCVLLGDCVSKLRELPDRSVDLVFADPPYAFEAFDQLLDTVSSWLVPGGGFALEHSKRAEPSAARAGLQRVDTRNYGESVLSFYSASGKLGL